MNEFLHLYRYFARCYINNIIIFSHIAKEHFQYLKTTFALFARFKVILKLKKIVFELFINYFI